MMIARGGFTGDAGSAVGVLSSLCHLELPLQPCCRRCGTRSPYRRHHQRRPLLHFRLHRRLSMCRVHPHSRLCHQAGRHRRPAHRKTYAWIDAILSETRNVTTVDPVRNSIHVHLVPIVPTVAHVRMPIASCATHRCWSWSAPCLRPWTHLLSHYENASRSCRAPCASCSSSAYSFASCPHAAP